MTTSQKDQSWIADLLSGTVNILKRGVALPKQSGLNFLGAVDGQDNPAAKTTDVTIGVPKFVTELASFAPPSNGARLAVPVDGYASTGDGGEGVFHWKTGTFTSDGGTVIVPSGYAGIGAWVRLRTGADVGRFNAAWYGVPTDGVSDCTASIQAVLDLNHPTMKGEVFLPSLSPTSDSLGTNTQKYFTSSPLVMNDYFPLQANGANGNACTRFRGLSQASVMLAPLNLFADDYNAPSWMGPLIIAGMMGDSYPAYVSDTYGGAALDAIMSGNGNGTYAITGTLSATPVGTSLVGSGTHFTTDLVRGMSIHIGSDVNQYQIQSVQDDTHATLSNAYIDASTTGATINVVPTLVALNYSEYDCGHLNGLASCCVEMFWNPKTDAPVAPTIYTMASSYGSFENIETHECFAIQRTNVFGSWRVQAQLITANGTYQVYTTGSGDLPSNVMSHIALDYDGAHLRLFINGAQPDSTMTTPATGAVLQKHYEEIIFCESENTHWPHKDGQIHSAGVHFQVGTTRVSSASRYTSPFTPTVANVNTCDAVTKLVLPLGSANRPTRGGLGEWVIGRSGVSFQGGLRNSGNGIPVWMRTHVSGFPYTTDVEISDMTLVNNAGYGILFKASLASNIHDLNFVEVEVPLTYADYSYEATIGPNINIASCGHAGSCFNSWGIGLLNGAQNTRITGVSYSGQNNWYLVSAYGDVLVEGGFLGSAYLGHFCLFNASATLINVDVDDENSSAHYALIVAGNYTGIGMLRVVGGVFFAGNAATPILKVGYANDIDFSGVIFASNTFCSFDSTQNNGLAVRFAGQLQGSNPLVDPSNPGPVIDMRKLAFGVDSIAMSDANYSATWTQIASRRIKLTGALTADRNFVIPTVLAGFEVEFYNATTGGHNVQVIGPTGSGITIANSKTAIVRTDGTNVLRSTADA